MVLPMPSSPPHSPEAVEALAAASDLHSFMRALCTLHGREAGAVVVLDNLRGDKTALKAIADRAPPTDDELLALPYIVELRDTIGVLPFGIQQTDDDPTLFHTNLDASDPTEAVAEAKADAKALLEVVTRHILGEDASTLCASCLAISLHNVVMIACEAIPSVVAANILRGTAIHYKGSAEVLHAHSMHDGSHEAAEVERAIVARQTFEARRDQYVASLMRENGALS
jgi:hypothetical protein